MALRTLMLMAALIPLTARAAPAQEADARSVAGDAGNLVRDVAHVWTSPLRVDAGEAISVLILAEAVGIVAASDAQLRRWVEAHPGAPPVRFGRLFEEPGPLSRLGRSWLLLSTSVVLYGAGLLADSDDLRTAGTGCATAAVATTFSRHFIARAIGRVRPRYDRGPYEVKLFAGRGWDRRSFPAGHAANIWSCASVWSHRFDLGLAEPALYAAATGVALGRITADAHWASDAVFGSVFGWAIGREVASRSARRAPAAALPADDAGTPRLYLGVSVGF